MAQTESAPAATPGGAMAAIGDVEWQVGAAAGAIATVVMGVAIAVTDVGMFGTIAGLYGQTGNVLAGWVVHVVHGTVFGLVFAATLSDPTLEDVAESHGRTVLAGLVYGVVLAVVAAGIILPIWATVVGLAGPTIPDVTLASLSWHLLYGGVLGITFATLSR